MVNILKDAMKNNYAVPQINANGILWLETTLKTAEKCQSPVIIATTDAVIDKLGGFKFFVSMYRNLKEELKITVPTILHFDHSQSVERCIEAVDAGYDSVMFDGSTMSIEENIAKTKQVVDYAKPRGVMVEAEVGSVGGIEDGVESTMMYADLNECLNLIKDTGVDCLAPALGSVHGRYKGEPNLGFEEMAELREETSVPFALHGASGISDEDLKKAISYGHAKINYNTEINIAWSDALRKVLNADESVYAPMQIQDPAKEAMSEVIEAIFKRTGAYNQVK